MRSGLKGTAVDFAAKWDYNRVIHMNTNRRLEIMRKTVLLNSEISSVISRMGHTDMLTVGDCGLPVPEGVQRIDLALKLGVPRFLEVLDTILEELCVERIILAEEVRTASPEMHEAILARFGDKVQVDYVPHEEFKRRTASSKAVVRTGECTPYANVILCSGVTF